jgi:hypothetical protein
MIYTEEFFIKKDKETERFLHFLQECKFSGSWDTKVNLNDVIKIIANYQFIVKKLREEIELLKNQKEAI